MIREVVYDFIALVVFPLGGVLCAFPLLSFSEKRGTSKKVKDLLIGLLPAPVFILLSEIFFESVITYFTIGCFLIGYLFTLIFFSTRKEKEGKKKAKRARKKSTKVLRSKLVK